MASKVDLKSFDIESLKKEIVRLKKELFDLRLNASGGQVKDYSQFKKIRKEIARALTFLNQKKKLTTGND